MILSNFNMNLLRVFDAVYRLKSMTKAASELHMTQSGVSQNIKNLEDLLEVTLFDRIKQKLVPTAKAHQLFQICGSYLIRLENTLADIKGPDLKLRGKVHIGIPIEFGNSIVLPLMAKWLNNHPGIEASFTYGWASAMNNLLLEGNLDFALVDNYLFDSQISIQKVWDETLLLCSSKEYLDRIGPYQHNKSFYQKCDFIDYAETGDLLQDWLKHHLKGQIPEIKIRASLMDVQGLARLVINGAGIGVLPETTVFQLRQSGIQLEVLEGSGKPLHNPISLASIKERSLSKVARSTMEYIKEEIIKLNQAGLSESI
ncbi:MAG: LysR family transcriptional regulator [Bdellovibrio sp.]